jgi:hypothetical protein
MSDPATINQSPYQLGFCTLDRETHLDALPVRGTVPPWLTCTLVRTAPAQFPVPDWCAWGRPCRNAVRGADRISPH